MTYLIKEIPLNERPRERLKNYGVNSLSNIELLSILLRTGNKNKSVKDLSCELLKKINIHELGNISYQTLKNINGIGEVKAMTIVAALELSKRVYSKKDNIIHIKTAIDVYSLVKEELENELQEKFLVLYLDNRHQLIDKKTIFIGTVNSSQIHSRDVFREAVKLNASSLIIIHNHPAGSLKPSKEDIFLTNQFIRIGKIMGIPVIDHLIISINGYYSFLEKNGDLFAT